MPSLSLFYYSRYSLRRFKALTSHNNSSFLSSLLFSTSRDSSTGNTQKPVRPGPPPIRVALTESAGRGVFATRRIGSGELIHTAKPVVSHPSLSAAEKVCYFCLGKVQNPRGDRPRRACLCSKECEEKAEAFQGIENKADWSAFEDYCRSRGLKYPLLVKRFACTVISGAVSSDLLDVLQPCSLSPQMIAEMEQGFGLLKCAFKAANILDEKTKFLTEQWYFGILLRIRINAFRIELAAGGLHEDLLTAAAACVEAEAAVGNAVYMVPSFYNHDCDPNTNIIWIKNTDARLTALRDIEEVLLVDQRAGLKEHVKGIFVHVKAPYAIPSYDLFKHSIQFDSEKLCEELRISYIDASMNCDARRAFLSQGFGFWCNCHRCLSGD